MYLPILLGFWAISCSHHKSLFSNTGKLVFKKNINELIMDSGLNANMGIKIKSLSTGETLYALNSEKLLLPASNNKLYTCATALGVLGSDFVFETSIYVEKNNLYLKGGGDPDFSIEQLDSLAQIVSSSLNSIDTIFVDESLMDTLHYGEGWMWDEGYWWYAAPVSALSMNDNCVDFYFHPGKLGEPADITVHPPTQYIQVKNQSVTVNDTIEFKKFKIERDWVGETNQFIISGELLDTTPKDTLIRNIVHPPLFAGTVMKEMLAERGISVLAVSIGTLPKNASKLVSHRSDSLLYSTSNLMNESDNLTAELLIKTLGITEENPGNWDDGITRVKTFLADSAGIDTGTIRMADGSGVSRYNLTSADHFIQLLSYMYQSPYSDDFLYVLANGGSKGTLNNRLTKNGHKIKAKTGHLSGVSCFSGYAFSPRFGPLAFSFMMNGYIGSAKDYQRLQDNILEMLVHD
ncbi:MAG: D-alanyl-D-alanine carboxypeptidase/D-alanyl-D-alanine-endopeptidase [Candidatus Marinimicrobia bacterium]|jgi:serine-type D-Ala-D-Ala carboxypeptidase/endopeptidase (penicillin-binding protein 4)|nr:D-alanyl-D-alanine carboxypeptidase/D-alanyl-D-alanine-endopeptidase [Candidatus Neomarinimicrobiota bacterium]MBT7872135.1 D-alanyl-D-alanine carboxypeptidase/D-alanyl-D-alanine-endopeptidase [Candidatus Neomarinimicrobiota bacterium]